MPGLGLLCYPDSIVRIDRRMKASLTRMRDGPKVNSTSRCFLDNLAFHDPIGLTYIYTYQGVFQLASDIPIEHPRHLRKQPFPHIRALPDTDHPKHHQYREGYNLGSPKSRLFEYYLMSFYPQVSLLEIYISGNGYPL
jgi:hypothetical protein